MALVEDAIHLGFLPEDKVLTNHFEFAIEFLVKLKYTPQDATISILHKHIVSS